METSPSFVVDNLIQDKDGYFSPSQKPRLGQCIIIDWTTNLSNKPPDVADKRTVIIDHIYHDSHFSIEDQDKSTEIYFDDRGGWTEIHFCKSQQRDLHYSHPVLYFQSSK